MTGVVPTGAGRSPAWSAWAATGPRHPAGSPGLHHFRPRPRTGQQHPHRRTVKRRALPSWWVRQGAAPRTTIRFPTVRVFSPVRSSDAGGHDSRSCALRVEFPGAHRNRSTVYRHRRVAHRTVWRQRGLGSGRRRRQPGGTPPATSTRGSGVAADLLPTSPSKPVQRPNPRRVRHVTCLAIHVPGCQSPGVCAPVGQGTPARQGRDANPRLSILECGGRVESPGPAAVSCVAGRTARNDGCSTP